MATEIEQLRQEFTQLRRRLETLESTQQQALRNGEKDSDLDLGNHKSTTSRASFSSRSFTTRSAVKWFSRLFLLWSLANGLAVIYLFLTDSYTLMEGYQPSVPVQHQAMTLKGLFNYLLFGRPNPFMWVDYIICGFVTLTILAFAGFILLNLLMAACMGEAALENALNNLKSGEFFRRMADRQRHR